jgi:hypothetical protein
LKVAVVLDSALTFYGHIRGDRFGRSFAIQNSGPAMIDAVKFGRSFFTRAIGFATGAGGDRDASRQQWNCNFEDNNFLFLGLHPNVYIH